MATQKRLTAAVTVKLKPEEAEQLREEAERRGHPSLGPFLRQVLLRELSATPAERLLLERLLAFEHAWFEFVDVSLRDGGITPEQMRAIRERAGLIAPDLAAGLLHRRAEVARAHPQGGAG